MKLLTEILKDLGKIATKLLAPHEGMTKIVWSYSTQLTHKRIFSQMKKNIALLRELNFYIRLLIVMSARADWN